MQTSWFSNFYGRIQNPLLIARDPMDNAVAKAAAASLGKELFFRTKRAKRIISGLKQKVAATVKVESKLPKPTPTPSPDSYGTMRKKMLSEL